MKNLLLLVLLSVFFAGCGAVNQYNYVTDKYLYKKNTVDREFKRYIVIQRNVDYDPQVFKQEHRIRVKFYNYDRTKIISSYIPNSDYNSEKLIQIIQGKRDRNDWTLQPFYNTSEDADKIFIYDIDGKTYIVSFYVGQHKFDSIVTDKDGKSFENLNSLFN